MNSTSTLEGLFNTFLTENGKFEGGNKSAGTRARKALMEISKLCKFRRSEIQEVKNTS